MTSLPFASVLDKGGLLVSNEIPDTLMMDSGSLLTWLVPFDLSSEYTSNTLMERPLSTTLVELGSFAKYKLQGWRFSFGDSFSLTVFDLLSYRMLSLSIGSHR